MKKIIIVLFLFNSNFTYSQGGASEDDEMMRSTFYLYGKASSGTCFILCEPKTDSTCHLILVTAKHVLDEMKGDSATIIYRILINGKYAPFHYKIPIRKNNKNIYVSHPKQDVSVINIAIPLIIDIYVLDTKYLANDKALIKNEVSPGMEISCLGFPLGQASNNAYFPILRNGLIASYPVYPTNEYPTFLYDVSIFKGNSGGPVYYSRYNYLLKNGKILTHKGKPKDPFMILGLISKERIYVNNSPYKSEQKQIYIAEVVHANYIIETIKLLNL
jgi:hypothetical protein